MIAHQITESLVITFTIHAEAINLNNEFCPSKRAAADIGVGIYIICRSTYTASATKRHRRYLQCHTHTHTYICKYRLQYALRVRRHWA